MTILFRVLVNGSEFTIAGESSMSVLTATIAAVGRLGPESHGTVNHKSVHPDIDFRVGGLTSRADRKTNKHFSWGTPLALKPGDTVTIEVLDAEASVKPTTELAATFDTRRGSASRTRWRSARNLYERMRRKYGAREEKLETSAARKVRIRRIMARLPK
jgi:hypothetical protein